MTEPTVHACPPKGSGLMPCCARTPFEVLDDPASQMTADPALVTCGGGLTLCFDIEAVARHLEIQAEQEQGGLVDGLRMGAAAVWALRRRHPRLGDNWSHEDQPCPGGDETCPGVDGDQCHFLGPGAWPIPTPQTSTGTAPASNPEGPT